MRRGAGLAPGPGELLVVEAQSSDRSANVGWLVFAAFGLLLVGTIVFVVGHFGDDLITDYISIACSSLAAIMLIVASRASKRSSGAGA